MGILQIKIVKADELLFKKGILVAQQKIREFGFGKKKKRPLT